jgi:antitoxin CptB
MTKPVTQSESRMPEQVNSALRWRCRRGMLELDILFNQFLDRQYAGISDAEKITFDQLLDYPDQLLFDLLLGHQASSDPYVTQLIQRIRQSVQDT